MSVKLFAIIFWELRTCVLYLIAIYLLGMLHAKLIFAVLVELKQSSECVGNGKKVNSLGNLKVLITFKGKSLIRFSYFLCVNLLHFDLTSYVQGLTKFGIIFWDYGYRYKYIMAI